MNVGEWIRKWSQIAPRKTAIIDDGHELSFGELNARCNKVANFLLKKGFEKGDRVAILAYNCHEFMEIYFAAAKIGAIFVPLNWRMAADEIFAILNDCSPKFLFFAQAFSDTGLALRERAEHLKHFVTIGQEDFAWAEGYEKIEIYPETEPSGFAKPSFEDPHIILYTSGTTGVPKGAVLSNRKTFFNALNADIFFKLTADDRFLVSRPLFHSGGLLIGSTPALYKGATVIYKRRFSPPEFLETIEKYNVTTAEPAATFLNFVLKECDLGRYNLKSLKIFYTGGERVPVTLLEDYHNRGFPLAQLFGMTETSTLTWLPTDAAFEKKGSVGKPVFHGEIGIRNKEDLETAPGEIGEIMVRGPILMSGYWNRPEQTANVIKNGWFHTGDLAKIDEQGFIYIVDRAKDMYISGGENIYPAEIEKLLLSNPGIFDAAVFGVPDEKWGEVGKAAIVLGKGVHLTSSQVALFLEGKIAKFKIPKYIEFVDQLPRTASGKLKKFLLVEKARKADSA
jgi:fatty-acyl-CoA synthase